MKKITLLLVLFLSFILVGVIPLNNTVKATTTTIYSAWFEGGIVGSDYDSSFFSTVNFPISNQYNRGGLKSINLSAGSTGYIYFKSSGIAVYHYYLWYRHWQPVPSAFTVYLTFFNRTLGVGVPIVKLGWIGSEKLQYWDASSVWQDLGLNDPDFLGKYIQFGFTLTNMLGDCDYIGYTNGTWTGFSVSGAVHNPTAVINGTIIDSLYVDFGTAVGNTLHIDDITIRTGTIPVYEEPVMTIDDFYTNKGYNARTKTYVETDKSIYNYGETVAIRFKTPTVQELQTSFVIGNHHTAGWILGILRNGNWWLPNPGSSDYYNIPVVCNPITAYGSWQYTSFFPPNPPTNIDNYEIDIEHDEPPLLWFIPTSPSYLFKGRDNGAKFQVINTGSPFIASGNITSITPQTSKIGDTVTISYNANNNCSITIRELSDAPEYFRSFQSVGKPPGTINTTYIPDTLGKYIAELRVFDGLTSPIKSYKYFNVTDTGNTSGSYGYNAEFLYIPNECFIAGYDTVSISYRSLKNNTRVTVTDSYGQRTPYSTNITSSAGILSIKLPITSKIGEWNVTMYGLETLFAKFSVIAEEGNFVEFTKNIFYSNEPLSVNIQHTHKTMLVFYKSNIPQGKNVVFPIGFISTGTYVVPVSDIPVSVGSWKVELWLTNNLTRIRLLSMATCSVESAPYERPNTTIYGFDIQGLPVMVKIVIAFVIVIVMALLPMLVAVMLSKGNISIEIPALVYVAFFFTGIIIDILLGLLEMYVILIVLFGLIMTFAITWMMNNRGSKT